MTPREWRAYLKCHHTTEERSDRRVAALMAFYINTHLREGKPPVTADDFMGKPRVSHNGHGDPVADMREFRRQMQELGRARPLNPDDPRARIDDNEINRYLETRQNG
jgi:hypothetical protein